jgi:hypothetical protein
MIRASATAAILATAALACSSPAPHAERGESPTKSQPSQPSQPRTTMPNAVEDPGLAPLPGMETDPLPADVLLRVQAVELGDFTRANYRLRLHDDGRLFVQKNSRAGRDATPPERFAAPWPAAPDRTLDPAAMDEIRREIRARHPFDLAAGYRDPQSGSEGALRVFELQLDGKHQRVVTSRIDIPVLAAIEELVWVKAR